MTKVCKTLLTSLKGRNWPCACPNPFNPFYPCSLFFQIIFRKFHIVAEKTLPLRELKFSHDD